jgi:NADH:ubiquinone oxidoreductase subunit F (NADH-binding)/(2Fe-2S) ferredoxin
MPSYAELVSRAEPARRRIEAAERPRIAVCVDTSSIAVGANETLAAMRAAVAAKRLAVDVDQVGGNGLSFANPVVEVAKPDGSRVLYQRVSAADAPDFVDSVLVRGEVDNRWLLGALSIGESVRRMDEHAWWAIQERRLMADMGVIDPEEIDQAIARGAYAGLARALGMAQEEVIAEVTNSRLRGRSGSDFPTGRKWDFLRMSPTSPKAMVCNADEGDPGAWVNRMTLENDPHALIEGMLIGGWATGASRGYIYLREEYPLAFERVEKAVAQAYERGLLGENILGRGFAFEMKVVRGAGSYVCGEESGLIASIEDGRGMPKIRPPFPAAAGVFGQGSNVNNVESYHSAALVLRHGVERYLEIDTGRNAGTMMFTLSGHVQRVGCFELPMSATVRDAYEVCGGGPTAGRSFKALQPGGPLLGIMPAFALDLPLEPEAFKEHGMAAMGGGGLVFLDDSDCVIDLCSQFEWFLEDESCGRCTTCHGGTQRMVEILRRIRRGGGRESDAGKLRLLAATLRYSNCIHGQAAPAIVGNALDWFAAEYEEHVYGRRCRAKVCGGLIRYEADRDAAGRPQHAAALARANQLCLAVAAGEATEACLSCLVCRELLPEAVNVVDAFEQGIGPAPEPVSVQPAER